jgi:hypothetical protein
MVVKSHPERSLTRLERWPLYIGGILTEAFYVLVLTGAALVMALVAKTLWR